MWLTCLGTLRAIQSRLAILEKAATSKGNRIYSLFARPVAVYVKAPPKKMPSAYLLTADRLAQARSLCRLERTSTAVL